MCGKTIFKCLKNIFEITHLKCGGSLLMIKIKLDFMYNLSLDQKIWNSMILLYSVSPTKFLVYVLYFGCWVYCLLVYGMTSMKLPNYMYTCSKWLCSFMKKCHLKLCDFLWKDMSTKYNYLYRHEYWWIVICHVLLKKHLYYFAFIGPNEILFMGSSITIKLKVMERSLWKVHLTTSWL